MTPTTKKERLPIVNIGDARIFFRNFSGKPGKFNREGERNFCVHLDKPGMAEDLKNRGYNVRYTKPRSEEDAPEPYIRVKVSFAKIPPKVALIKGEGNPVYLEEDAVSLLDWADISKIDLVLNPSSWTMADGKAGTTAYLKAGYFTIVVDAFESKYLNPAESGEEPSYEEGDV